MVQRFCFSRSKILIEIEQQNRIKGQKQKVKGHDIFEMSNCVKIIVGTMAKGKDIMLKIAVIDDEKYNSELIRQTVCNWLMEKGCQGEIDCFDHADDFKTQIENGRCYDIYFMDIEMPDISGMELASYVRMKYDSPFIVFVTAHMEYSVKCYRYHAWQYITKDSIRTLIPETMDSLIQHLQAHKSNYYMIGGANDLIRIAMIRSSICVKRVNIPCFIRIRRRYSENAGRFQR